MPRRPQVNKLNVAQKYAAPNERIIEFSSEFGGGLISFRDVDGRLVVSIYRHDSTVIVNEAHRAEA